MTRPRLFVADALAAGACITLEAARAHYLAHVLRLKPGAELSLFNPSDGQWSAVLDAAGRHRVELRVVAPERAATAERGPILCFAPIRQNRLDWLVEKAVELGVAALEPVLTERAVVKLGRPDRLQAIVVEAAEQCGRLTVPPLAEPTPLADWLATRAGDGRILFADEQGGMPLAVALREDATRLLIGPEGGFTEQERLSLREHPTVVAVSLGPLILRAETAALYALSAWQMARTTDSSWSD